MLSAHQISQLISLYANIVDCEEKEEKNSGSNK